MDKSKVLSRCYSNEMKREDIYLRQVASLPMFDVIRSRRLFREVTYRPRSLHGMTKSDWYSASSEAGIGSLSVGWLDA